MIERPTPWEQLDGMKFVLEQILEQAVEWERSRIIKLLETEIERFEHEDFYAVGVTNGLIELIKGETK